MFKCFEFYKKEIKVATQFIKIQKNHNIANPLNLSAILYEDDILHEKMKKMKVTEKKEFIK